jgi:hypothetical protein
MRRQAHLLRVEVVAAGQEHAVELVEDRGQVVLLDERRDHHRDGVGREQAVVVAAVHEAMQGAALGGGSVVRIDPDQGAILHGWLPFPVRWRQRNPFVDHPQSIAVTRSFMTM